MRIVPRLRIGLRSVLKRKSASMPRTRLKMPTPAEYSRRRDFLQTACCALLLFAAVSPPSRAAEPPNKAAREIDYLRDVKPILSARCAACHGAEKKESGLRLDNAAAAIAGGDSGPAIVRGDAKQSLLIDAVTAGELVEMMPPKGEPLTEQQVAILRDWIDQGARFPADEEVVTVKLDHWSFKRPARPSLPQVDNADWPHNAIDYFVLARLEKEGVTPSAPAQRATLMRRVCFDLTGIPPTVAEVDAFLADTSEDAYERLVDRLLASPHYGERWGRHWLDVARYADSNGFTRDFGREIWKYRDWVIAAVNRDLPFDQFTIEQFAGDMLPDATLDQIIATGFHRNTLINEEGGTDAEQFRVDAVADRVATTGVAFLGLTLECARCHEHKYDPISQREYYQVFAFLNNCDEPAIDAPSSWQIDDVRRRDTIRTRINSLEKQLDEMADEFTKQQLAWEKTVTPELRRMLPGPLQAALDLSPAERDEPQTNLVEDYYKTTEHARSAFTLVAEIADLRASEPKIPTTMVMRERSQPRATHVHLRGNFLDEGRQVLPAVPAALHALPRAIAEPNRLDFARWLVAEENPLTARVVVNRDWLHFFGRGIVQTENDFGVQGTPPTHPQLLDWLAVELVERGWSRKALHRLIVTSATYQQSSRVTSEQLARDPYNKLFARQSRFRFDAEIIRDAALSVSGLLTCRIGGPSVHPPQPDGVFDFTQDPKPWIAETDGDRYRRGMYTFLWRSSPYPSLTTFDFPEPNTTCTRRVRSNTPLQSLVLANDVTFVEAARALAGRLLEPMILTDAERAARAFRICLSRSPSADEQARLVECVQRYRSVFAANEEAAKQLAGDRAERNDVVELAKWTAVCRVLLNLDEFITRE